MTPQAPVVAVTGASGYLGERICATFESQGWRVVRFVRSMRESDRPTFSYDLAMPVTAQVREALKSADALVHAAYDLSLTSASDIWRVNVEGTRHLLAAAADARVGRVVVLSSMSAFDGTTQLYGRAKLDIEAMASEFGACAMRPGLVYGEQSGGMAGALRRLITLPITPVIAGGTGVYTVREDDLMAAIAKVTAAEPAPSGTISVAHPSRVTLVDLLRVLADQEGRKCRLVPIPWWPVYWLLRAAELVGLHLPFRADSLLGLINTAPCLSGVEKLTDLGITLRAFAPEPIRTRAHERVT
jgi:nucleoside-diphosphate-sugar epimerase